MEEQREEVYERIPWEAIGDRGRDRQWWILGLAAALGAGALGYSFMTSRAVGVDPAAAEPVTSTVATNAPATGLPAPVAVPSTAPVAVAEADLYAVSPGSLATAAENHALWFVHEYLASDGSGTSDPVLRNLLPADLPMPGSGGMVFVEWVGIRSSNEVVPGLYRVEIVARYLTAPVGGEYQRMEPALVSVDVDVSGLGPVVVSAPTVESSVPEPSPALGLGPVPEEIVARAEEQMPNAEVIGGMSRGDGHWDLVVMAPVAGVTRPIAITIAP